MKNILVDFFKKELKRIQDLERPKVIELVLRLTFLEEDPDVIRETYNAYFEIRRKKSEKSQV